MEFDESEVCWDSLRSFAIIWKPLFQITIIATPCDSLRLITTLYDSLRLYGNQALKSHCQPGSLVGFIEVSLEVSFVYKVSQFEAASRHLIT